MSEQITIASLIEEIHADLPDCPRPLMIKHLRDSMRDFCNRTRIWQEDHAPITTRAGITDYLLHDIPDYAELVTNGGVFSAYRGTTEQEAGRHYIIVDKNTFRLLSTPTTTTRNDLCIRLSLRPCDNALHIHTENFPLFISDWRQAIAAGAMATLMRIGRKPWTDRDEAREQQRAYLHGVSEAKVKLLTGGANADLTAKATPPFVRLWASGRATRGTTA